MSCNCMKLKGVKREPPITTRSEPTQTAEAQAVDQGVRLVLLQNSLVAG